MVMHGKSRPTNLSRPLMANRGTASNRLQFIDIPASCRGTATAQPPMVAGGDDDRLRPQDLHEPSPKIRVLNWIGTEGEKALTARCFLQVNRYILLVSDLGWL